MDDYDITQLPTEKVVVFVISTTGQGEPTATMKTSWKFLTRKDLPKDSLKEVNFTVFGLGDSSYEIFNAMARKLYQRLLQLGASCFHDRALGDDQHDFGYEAEFDPWLESLWDDLYKLDESLKPEELKPEDSIEDSIYNVDIIPQAEAETSLTEEEKKFLESNSTTDSGLNTLKYLNDPLDMKSEKLFATIQENKRITSDELKEVDDKETKHVELQFGDQKLEYSPGDVCCIMPRNRAKRVAKFIEILGLNEDDLLRITHNPDAVSSSSPVKFPPLVTVKELFEYWLNTLGVPNRYFFKVMAHFTVDDVRSEKLHILSAKTSEGKNEYYRYCHRERRNHVDILYDFSTTKIPMGYLIQLLGAHKPREFSIASSQLVNPDSIHLTMGVLRYKTYGLKRQKIGVCSGYIGDLPVGEDEKVLCYIKAGTFLLPDLQTPIICIGAGTGVAPFRSVIQERAHLIKQEELKFEDPPLVLFYGCRNEKDDDYYTTEWEGLSSDLKVFKAYSRVGDSKVYVQHLIKQNPELMAKYLVDKNASVFIAGHSKFMPKSVEKAFIEVLSTREEVNAEEYIKLMKKQGRYIVEAW